MRARWGPGLSVPALCALGLAPWLRALRSPPLLPISSTLLEPARQPRRAVGMPPKLGAQSMEEQPKPASAPARRGVSEGRAEPQLWWCWVFCALNGSGYCCRSTPRLALLWGRGVLGGEDDEVGAWERTCPCSTERVQLTWV